MIAIGLPSAHGEDDEDNLQREDSDDERSQDGDGDIVEQGINGLLVFLFGLLNYLANNELIKDLPHCHRVVGLEQGDDRTLDLVDLGPGPPWAFYWACLIKVFGRAHCRRPSLSNQGPSQLECSATPTGRPGQS